MAIDYSGDRVAVTTFGRSKLTADYVLVTVPLEILKHDVIKFTPPLPDAKQAAIRTLGAGVLEKVTSPQSIQHTRTHTHTHTHI